MNKAFAQSGQTSRPVTVFSNGSRTLRRQSGHSRVEDLIAADYEFHAGGMDQNATVAGCEVTRGRLADNVVVKSAMEHDPCSHDFVRS
jgi:hypothetical protein